VDHNVWGLKNNICR